MAMEGGGIGRWEELQVDCLVNIFRRLGLDDLTLAVPFVCRSWYRASLDVGCWRVLNLQELDFLPWSSFARRFTAQYHVKSFSFTGFMKVVVARGHGWAAELRFPRSYGATMEDVVYASLECARLKSVSLPSLSLEEEPQIPELVGRWGDLERLEMPSKPSSFLSLVAEIGSGCRNFVGLKMSGAIKQEDAHAIVKHLPKLEHLELCNSYVTKEELAVIVDGCKELERLLVTDCFGFQADEELMEMASAIKTFHCEGSKMLDGHGYETDESELELTGSALGTVAVIGYY